MTHLDTSALAEAISISLMSDAKATTEEIEARKSWDGSMRGYWAEEIDGVLWGSKLWLLDRAPKNQETLDLAKQYASDALKWLVEDEYADAIDIRTLWKNDDLSLTIVFSGFQLEACYVF